jgi:hypothetical protein
MISRATVAILALIVGIGTIVVGVSLGYPQTVGSQSPQTARAFAVASNGLNLSATLTPSNLAPGGVFNLTVEVVNSLSPSNNVSASVVWPLASLQGPCHGGILSVSFYKGSYSSLQSAIGAQPLSLNPPGGVPCPARPNFTSYIFSPNSNSVAGYVGPNSTISFPARLSTLFQKYYDPSASQMTDFATGSYTVIVGDIWGSLVFLPFSVS